jgi:hypothetical protein
VADADQKIETKKEQLLDQLLNESDLSEEEVQAYRDKITRLDSIVE